MKSSLSLFAQIVQIIPKARFARAVQKTGAQRHSKGFASWYQFVSMLFCQFANCKSLREISDGLAATFIEVTGQATDILVKEISDEDN